MVHTGQFEQWQNVETIFLDMDGTLLDLYFDNHFWLEHMPLQFAAANQISHQQAHSELMQRYNKARGTLEWYCIDYWSDQLKLDIRKLKREQAHMIAIRPNVSHFLEAVNASDKRVVMVTNAHPATVEIKLEQTGIHHHFDRILNAHEIGLAKEQAGFWRQLNATERYDKRSTMLIDDNLEVLQSANEFGIEYLFGILQPDSQQKNVDAGAFMAIDDFAEFVSGI
jgi:putative hydrolase of the HAD superfamily